MEDKNKEKSPENQYIDEMNKIRKVNLDIEFKKWKDKNEESLKEKFLDIHNFNEYLDCFWREYQDENGLINKEI